MNTPIVYWLGLLFCGLLCAQDAPVYKVDPFWPKRLPNKWIMQQVVDIGIDRQDRVWLINRPDPRPDEMGAATTPPRAECCTLGAEIMRFDAAGNLLKSWSGTGIAGWPQRLQSLDVDRSGNIWISGTAAGEALVQTRTELAMMGRCQDS